MKCAYCKRYTCIRITGDDIWHSYCHAGHYLLPCDGEGHYTDEQGKQHKCKQRKNKRLKSQYKTNY